MDCSYVLVGIRGIRIAVDFEGFGLGWWGGGI